MSEIAGRHIVITGAASGIGRLMALALAGLGGRISAWDINRERLDATVAELNALHREPARGIVCDVAKRGDVYRVAAETTAAAGAVDMLINNAGIVSGKRFLELPDEKIEATFAINTLSLFWLTKAFLPAMIERNRGHIVTIASASALIGVARLTDYSASKWAAMAFDESLRAELRQIAPGVRTTVVCPFYIDTGMFHGVKSRFPRLLPILKEADVAARVVRAIERDQARVMMPWIVYLVPAMRLLPVPVFDWAATFLGINASMEEFVGRPEGHR
jgi:all-trans-retinol dehydrogenase (NAD+)